MADVALVALSVDDADRYADIRLSKYQEVFGGRPADAFASITDKIKLFGIEEDGRPVGLFRLQFDYDTHDFARPGEVGIRFFLVNQADQGRGIAGAALALLPALVREIEPGAPSLALTVNVRNPGAKRAYEKAGFVDLKELYLGGAAGPQHIMRMNFEDG